MFKIGHWGMSLLVWAPVAFVLLRMGYPALALIGGTIMLVFSRLPDKDHELPLIDHRGITHTLLFAVLIGGVVAVPSYLLGASGIELAGLDIGSAVGLDPAFGLGLFGFATGTLAIGAHLLADALTPAGVPLLYPLSGWEFSFYFVQASNTLANYGLFVLGLVATAAAGAVGLQVVPA